MRDEIKAFCQRRGHATRAALLAGVSYRTFYTTMTNPGKVSETTLAKVTDGLRKLKVELQTNDTSNREQLEKELQLANPAAPDA